MKRTAPPAATPIPPTRTFTPTLTPTPTPDASSHYIAGQNYYRSADYYQAIVEFTNAIRLGLNDWDVYNSRAWVYALIGEYGSSLEDANVSLELRPGNPYNLDTRGWAYVGLGEYELAILDFSLAIRLVENFELNVALPVLALVYEHRGAAYYHLGQYQAAIDDFGKAIDLDSKFAMAHYDRGLAYDAIGQSGTASRDINQACSLIESHKIHNEFYEDGRGLDCDYISRHTLTPTPSSFAGTHGTIIANDMGTFDIGSGRLQWSGSGTQIGYFYTGSQLDIDPPNPVLVAGVTPSSDCGKMPGRPPGPTHGYTGLSDINDLTDASSLIYTRAPTDTNSEGAVYFGTKAVEGCDNEGMLVFSQAGRYGVLDFVVIDDSIPWTQATPWTITINWWLGFPGITDFSQAPDNP